ncbi:hypothetical protein C8Q80DRAFT_1265030 [Daedaleopsis nitida]|nr:hypothetical protein C8Q80DRAFT_1265030 [Daedaleopsis nitida]
MGEPIARIRPVEVADQKLLLFTIGKAGMEPIATANRKMYVHPLVLAAWIGLSSVFIEYMKWWPDPEHGYLGYLSPAPAFGTLSIVFMFVIDWLNRWGFEERSAHVLRRPDLVDIPRYYSRSASSGFWVLQYGDRIIGHIALDASLDADSDEALPDKTVIMKDRIGQVAMPKGTSTIATIRHFYVDEEYRPAGMANDLLDFALSHAFTADAKLEAVRAYDSPLQSYIGVALRSQGFKLEKKAEKFGALRWQSTILIMDRGRWATEQR